MNVVDAFRKTQAALASLSGVLSVCRMQLYNRVDAQADEKIAEMAMLILMREDETSETLFRDMDAVVAAYGGLRGEIAARRIAVKS